MTVVRKSFPFFCIASFLWGAACLPLWGEEHSPPQSREILREVLEQSTHPPTQKGNVDSPTSTKDFPLTLKKYWETPEESGVDFFVNECKKGSTLAWFYLAAMCFRVRNYDKIFGPIPPTDNLPSNFFAGPSYSAFVAGVAKAPFFLFLFMAPHLARERLHEKPLGLVGCSRVSQYLSLELTTMSFLTPLLQNMVPDFSENAWSYDVLYDQDITRACYYVFCLYMESYEKMSTLLKLLEQSYTVFASTKG